MYTNIKATKIKFKVQFFKSFSAIVQQEVVMVNDKKVIDMHTTMINNI